MGVTPLHTPTLLLCPSGAWPAWVQGLPLLLPGCVTLGRWLNLSEAQLPHL